MKHKSASILIAVSTCSILMACTPDVAGLAPAAPDQPWKPAQTSAATPTEAKTPDHESTNEMPALKGVSKFEVPVEAQAPVQRDEVPVDTKRTYTLPELIDLAEQNNPDTRIAWEQSKQAAYAVGLAEATYLPEISAEVLGGEQHTPLPIPKDLVSKGYFTADTNEVLPSLVIKWLLFDFGQRDNVVEAAKQTSIASNIAFTGTHQKLIFEVSKAYFSLAAEREQLHVAEDALKTAKVLQDAAEAKGKSGLETKPAIAIAQRGTAKAEYDLAEAQGVDNDAYHALLEAIGLTPTLKLQIADSSGRSLPKSLADDVDSYINRALARRPDIVAALAKVRASEAEVSGAHAAYYPTLGLEGDLNQNIGSVSIDGGPTYHVNEPAAAVLLRLKLPLYDGGTRDSALEIAHSRNEEAKEELKKAQDEAIRQVAKAYDEMKSALAEYNAALALVKASDTAYTASLEGYRQGVGTFTDAVTSETGKTQAQSVKANAYATVLTAAAALAFSTGDLTSIDALNNPS